jgi:membrane fusion protein, heavy metal efflux system
MKVIRSLICYMLCLSFLLGCTTAADKSEADLVSVKEDAIPNEVSITKEQFILLGIELGKPEMRSMSGSINANGMLDVPPQNLVTISAPLGGFVKNTELLQGMKVKKGQTVVVMEHPDYIQLQEDYLTAKNQLEFLELEFNRQEELAKENVTATKALQQAKSNYFGTKAKVQGIAAKLKLININVKDIEAGSIRSTVSIQSPIAGYVTQVNVNIGVHVSPTDVMFKIVDTDHLHAEVQVFEKDIPQLRIGQLVRIYLSNEAKERTAKVYLIGKEITLERTVRVHCHLEVEDPSLIPGLYFKASIETDPRQVATLPNEAILDFADKPFVFVESEPGRFSYEMVEVQKGRTDREFSEVVLPSSIESKKIVLKGAFALMGVLKNTEEE